MRRRDVLTGLGAAATAAAVGSRVQAASDTDLSVLVIVDGRQLHFSQSAGVDLGDYQTSHFTQRCIRCDLPDSPLTVFFRPDRETERVEIVVELGRMWGAANAAAAHMGGYRAVISRGGREVAVVDVPRHWWFARWRWQSAPRPIIRKPSELIAAKLLPPYALSVAKNAEPAHQSTPVEYDRPMDTAGLQTAVGAAGGRNEIGPITEYQADYIITGSSAALAALRAQAEAAASMPMHVRDERTHAPVDFFQYPSLDWYMRPFGQPWVKGSESIRDANGQYTCEWSLDAAHDPALNYVPFLLTGDPYHLEELQFQGNRILGFGSYHRNETKLQIVYPGETRSFAWSMRTMFQLAAVTPEVTPRWLKPRQYWKRIVDDNLVWFSKHYVRNPSPATSVFAAGPILDAVAAWMEDWVAFCIGWGVMMGFEEWREAFRWKMRSTLARTDGRSGWPRQWCTPYYFSIASQPPHKMYTDRSPNDIWLKSWSEAWDAFRADPKNDASGTFPDKTSWAQPNTPEYLIHTRGTLALATHLGVEDAREPFLFVNRMAELTGVMKHNWAVAPADGA